MEFEKFFAKNYKNVCLDMRTEQIDNRLNGIDSVIEWCDSFEKTVLIVKMYFKVQCDETLKEEFIDCFYSLDKAFDEENEEEIAILAGCILVKMIQELEQIEVAYLMKILAPFFENRIKEMTSIADKLIKKQTKEGSTSTRCGVVAWEKDWQDQLAEKGKTLSTAPAAYIEIFEKIKKQLSATVDYSNSLLEKNAKCEQKIAILSWIVGEWSDLLETSLHNVKGIVGALILGVELADLVEMPGVYAAETFLYKMLSKCEKTKEKVSLTELVDSQKEEIRKLISDKYGENAEENYLPILSAINASVTVEEEKVWIPAYKKAWNIKPDEITLPLIEWSKLVYFECMVSKY